MSSESYNIAEYPVERSDDVDYDEPADDVDEAGTCLNVSLTSLNWLQNLNAAAAIAAKQQQGQLLNQEQSKQLQATNAAAGELKVLPALDSITQPKEPLAEATNSSTNIKQFFNEGDKASAQFKNGFQATPISSGPYWSPYPLPMNQPFVNRLGPHMMAEPCYPAGLVGGFEAHRRPMGLHVVGQGRGIIELGPSVDYRTNGQIKPPYSYATLIWMAMQATPGGKVSLSNIYDWIQSNFAFFKYADCSWQNSIRHNLSMNKCFEKVPRGKNDEPGKGGFWRINPSYLDPNNNSLATMGLGYRPPHALPSTSTAALNCSRKRRCVAPPIPSIRLPLPQPNFPGYLPSRPLYVGQGVPPDLSQLYGQWGATWYVQPNSAPILQSPQGSIFPATDFSSLATAADSVTSTASSAALISSSAALTASSSVPLTSVAAPISSSAAPNAGSAALVANTAALTSQLDSSDPQPSSAQVRLAQHSSASGAHEGSPFHYPGLDGSDVLVDLLDLSCSSMMGEELLSQSGINRLTADIVRDRNEQGIEPGSFKPWVRYCKDVTMNSLANNEENGLELHYTPIGLPKKNRASTPPEIRVDATISSKSALESLESFNNSVFSSRSEVNYNNLTFEERLKLCGLSRPDENNFTEADHEFMNECSDLAPSLKQDTTGLQKKNTDSAAADKEADRNKERVEHLERLVDKLDDFGLSSAILPFAFSPTNENHQHNDLAVRGVAIRPSVLQQDQSDVWWEGDQNEWNASEDVDDDIFGFNPDRTLDNSSWMDDAPLGASHLNDFDPYAPNFCSDVDSIF